MKVLIYGAGGVGLGVASCLLKSGITTDVVARPNTVHALCESGLFRTGIFGEAEFPPEAIGAYTGITELEPRDHDFVLVCTKASDSRTAAADLATALPVGWKGLVVLFQNGMGNAEEFRRYFPSDQILCARVITGFLRHHPNAVEITVHADDIRVGWPAVPSPTRASTDAVDSLCEAIRKGGIPCSRTDSILEHLWAKMLYNCALNSLGAVFEVTYGELAEMEESRAIMRDIVREVFAVMTAAGQTTHWGTAEEYLEAFYRDFVPPTRAHYPSTLQDLRAGKPTEIEALNGAVLRLAEKHGIPVPVNEVVYRMVKFKEQGERQDDNSYQI